MKSSVCLKIWLCHTLNSNLWFNVGSGFSLLNRFKQIIKCSYLASPVLWMDLSELNQALFPVFLMSAFLILTSFSTSENIASLREFLFKAKSQEQKHLQSYLSNLTCQL